jgi:hypothetical protein
VTIRPATWEDLDAAATLLARNGRVATGVGVRQPGLLRGVTCARSVARARQAVAGAVAGAGLVGGVAPRTFAPADAAALHDLLEGAYRGWDGRYVPLPRDAWVQQMTEDYEFDQSVWWLVQELYRQLGFAVAEREEIWSFNL